ncbi:hypothetical protein Sjap_018548 [Stephania japonica]|uniref:Toprim domain-containing protein n=1 Tax=Stephania japonica TaxID=461633 RepID=A0AAP0I883_9MAGN
MPPYHRPVKSLFAISSSNAVAAAMASKLYYFLKPKPFLRNLQTQHYRLFSPFPSTPTSPILLSSFKKSGFCFAAHSSVHRPLNPEVEEASQPQSGRLTLLKMRLESEGIQCAVLKPGEYSRLLCPKCLGGDLKERSFSLYICPDWQGNMLIGTALERNVDGEGVLRNAVMRKSGDQEMDAEKILYGLDDIKGASEIDKLAMEEAGFRNCVSVPDGAPSKVNPKELPSETEDTKFQYLWNCKEYLDKASRIILATDANAPGQALAEELARHLGRERRWRVKWPKPSSERVCKDANENMTWVSQRMEGFRSIIQVMIFICNNGEASVMNKLGSDNALLFLILSS